MGARVALYSMAVTMPSEAVPSLKPCRFCGSEGPHTLVRLGIKWVTHSVRCINCKARGSAMLTSEEAVEKWNGGGIQ